jgi:hypothetical protein
MFRFESEMVACAEGSKKQGASASSPYHWSLTEMPQDAWSWTICGSGKILNGNITLPEGSFLFLGSGRSGSTSLYLDGITISGALHGSL